jgi:hypothetical protein
MRIALGLLFVSAACRSPTTPSTIDTASLAGPIPLVTIAEASGYQRTGRYDEVATLCRDFGRRYRGLATCEAIGTTAQDRPIWSVRVEKTPNLPVIYIQGGIHAGEIDGKDAGFAFVRDLLAGTIAPGALDAVAIVFVPVINPDGHERFGPNHRPNQRGPEEMGFRTNGARLNINRDFMKADTQEMHAVLDVVRTRDPVLLIDLHTTDGAKFEHDISINVAPVAARGDRLDETAKAFERGVVKRLGELGHLPVPFYPAFRDDEDPLSGFETGEAPPRFSQMYAAARGRLGLLVETHSWRTYPERVASTYHTLQAVAEAARTQAGTWRQVADEASRSDARLAGRLPLIWKTTGKKTEIEFRGYRFEKRTSELTGGTWLVYDEKAPQIWKVPLFEELEPAISVDVPRGGYVIDGGFAKQIAAVLDRHGIRHVPIAGQPKLAVETFRAAGVKHSPPFEGRTRVTLEGAWRPETRTLDRGARFVPIAQPLARLVLHFFEPSLPDSFAQWGFFNAAFEQKEYLEPYMLEVEARRMLARDPKLRERYDAALLADPELAKHPHKKLQWFYKQHPAWDERVNLLPVYRLDHSPAR